MKRVAEKQLSKDDLEEDVDETEGQQGFQKADEDTLATRKIRGLPRRSTVPAIPVIASTEGPAAPVPTSKFGSFSGFGTPGSTHSFTFTPPESPASGLGVSPPSSLNPSPAPAFGNMSSFKAQPFVPPVIAPAASSAAKTIGSIIQNPPSFKSAEPSGGPSSAAQKYYTSLRGLNKSFIDAVTKAYADDPLADWSETHFETYKKHLLALKAEFDTSEATKQKATAPTIFSSSFGKSQPAAGSTPASESTPKPSSSTTSSATPVTFAPLPSSASKSDGLSFPSGSTTFPATSGSDNNKLPFSFSKSVHADATNASGPSLAPSPFGIKGSSSSFTFAPSDSKDNGMSKSTTTGGPVASNFFATPPTSASSNLGALGAFGGFGKPPSGSIGNPVGFGFGDSNVVPFRSKSDDKTEDDAVRDSSKPDGEDTVAPPILLANSPHDEEGEGEEDEETTYSIKAKTYWMNRETGKWQDMGHGVLRLKKHKEKGTRRMLQRNSSTGKINLNFNLYAGLKPTLTNRAITFIGHDENGVAQSYSVRTKTEDQLHALRGALEREISFVKAKDE
ncbi:uncharacterized protein BT62DRAFT_1075924 [Guyanagaster necrorhizus]|uniref:RanBD1 domain-containing protein n=1 Tax=Guyanagaster necrorhizus TaxID=856835 RepID=A0A9P8ASN7_9AGAR|nr:uncharacterized protein BT62DRAFT_1075924 [Guyanagaster necrorhizus MCA 3950]KAG7446345.1 hypothetical protein BT62DRAFT_1075924 [Guyanagaster necrorhizus MCA 3950]